MNQRRCFRAERHSGLAPIASDIRAEWLVKGSIPLQCISKPYYSTVSDASSPHFRDSWLELNESCRIAPVAPDASKPKIPLACSWALCRTNRKKLPTHQASLQHAIRFVFPGGLVFLKAAGLRFNRRPERLFTRFQPRFKVN